MNHRPWGQGDAVLRVLGSGTDIPTMSHSACVRAMPPFDPIGICYRVCVGAWTLATAKSRGQGGLQSPGFARETAFVVVISPSELAPCRRKREHRKSLIAYGRPEKVAIEILQQTRSPRERLGLTTTQSKSVVGYRD